MGVSQAPIGGSERPVPDGTTASVNEYNLRDHIRKDLPYLEGEIVCHYVSIGLAQQVTFLDNKLPFLTSAGVPF